MRSPARPHLASLIGLSLSAVVGVAHLGLQWKYTIEDAYVTFRVAHNAAKGLGLVTNADEYVKCYSNTLVTLLAVGSEWMGLSSEVFIKCLSALCYGLMIFMMARYAALRGSRSRSSCRDSRRVAMSPGSCSAPRDGVRASR